MLMDKARILRLIPRRMARVASANGEHIGYKGVPINEEFRKIEVLLAKYSFSPETLELIKNEVMSLIFKRKKKAE